MKFLWRVVLDEKSDVSLILIFCKLPFLSGNLKVLCVHKFRIVMVDIFCCAGHSCEDLSPYVLEKHFLSSYLIFSLSFSLYPHSVTPTIWTWESWTFNSNVFRFSFIFSTFWISILNDLFYSTNIFGNHILYF